MPQSPAKAGALPGEGLGKKVYGPEFRRGFLEAADVTPKAFLAKAEELFRRFPLRCLHVGGRSFGDPALRLLAASPYLARLSRLELHSGQVTAAGVAALTPARIANTKRLIVSSADGPRR